LESAIEASYVAQARSNTTVRRSDIIIDPSTPIRLEKRKTLRTLFELSRETFYPKSRRSFVDSLLRQTVFLHCLIAMYGGLGLTAERLIWAPFSHRLASLPRLLVL
jgi:hypothetical protein